jgi:exopolysaccharide biosynthesis polyprenyl glycosylphosphotransferase
LLHLLADCGAILLAFWLAYWLRFDSGLLAAPLGRIEPKQWWLLAEVSCALWLSILALHGAYYARLKQAFSAELGAVTSGLAQGFLATIVLTFALRGLPDSRLALLMALGLTWLLCLAIRALARKLRQRRPQALVIGSSHLAQYLKRQFGAKATRFDLAGAYDGVTALPTALPPCDALFCDVDQANELSSRLKLDAADTQMPSLHFIPTGEGVTVGALTMATVEGVPTLALKSAADLAVMRAIKRCVDIPGALLCMLLTAPLWLICIIGIAVTMPGPLFFQHKRRGLFGRPFGLYKFRSMVKDAHKIPVADMSGFDDKFKLKNDPRITAFGKFMRRMSLDELPQFLNILRGELSLVGPRPIVEAELEKYGPWGALLNTVPPGLSGLWQVSGRSDTTYQERIDFDLYYINNWSLGLDLLILLRTIPAVLSRKGAY